METKKKPKEPNAKTKVVEIYQEGTVSLSVERTIIAVVPEKWTEQEIEDHLNKQGSDVPWSDYDEDGADAHLTQIKEIPVKDAEIDENWSD